MRVLFIGHLCFFLSRLPTIFSQSAHSVRVGEKILCSLRVILYMGSPQIFNFWGERKQQSPNDASVIHCDLLAERESSAQTILRSSFATSAFTDAFFVYYSRIVFGYFSPKSTFIKISLPLYLPNPPRVKDQGRTKDEPRNTQRTPNHPKVLFIKIGYLKEIFVTVASAICLSCQMPLSISFTPLCKVSLHSRTSAKMSHR